MCFHFLFCPDVIVIVFIVTAYCFLFSSKKKKNHTLAGAWSHVTRPLSDVRAAVNYRVACLARAAKGSVHLYCGDS